jgi:L-galactose dehydrogenase/L-glyceraldehyde 3-phosphate reductase
MDYRPLGRTGLSVSAIGFGCGSIGGLFVRGTPEDQRVAVSAALQGGVNYFDTAAQYGEGRSEENLGRTLRDLAATPLIGTKLSVTRAELPRATAVIEERLRAGLGRLGVEQVTVCTLHSRIGPGDGELTVGEVLGSVAGAMRALVDRGLASAIGFTGLGDTKNLLEVATSGAFDTFQCYFNVLNQSAARPGSPDGVAQDFGGLLAEAAKVGLGAFCIRALAGGALADAEERHPLSGSPGRPMAAGEDYNDDRARANELLSRLGEFGTGSLVELAVRFALGEVRLSTVLLGISDRGQIEQALQVASLGALAAPALDALVQPAR